MFKARLEVTERPTGRFEITEGGIHGKAAPSHIDGD
jgi:hypothetical protein